MNRIRSSRELEKETRRNIEVMWLLKGLSPDHNTISNFRRDNPNAIKKVFRATVALAKHFNLIGGKLLAGDSTKLRAQNSRKNNFNEKKIQRHLEYIENKLGEYEKQLAENDGDKDKERELKQQIETQQQRKQSYENIQKQLVESGEVQVSTSDPESRQMITRNNITEVASHAPDSAFDVENFQYDVQSDTYTCPAAQTLTTNGHWYNKSRGKSINKIKQYTTKACAGCSLRDKCTNNKGGRMLERSEHADLTLANKERVDINKYLYRRRQAIVEHPYGTIKRQRGFSYIMTMKTIKRASADVGLIFTAYNLRRISNLIGKEALSCFALAFLCYIAAFLASLELFWRRQKKQSQLLLEKMPSLQRMYVLI